MRLANEERLVIERRIDPADADTLAYDVVRGLSATPKWLPPKHFYDEAGGALFEQICDLPEYYVTRVEESLLEDCAEDIVRAVRPSHLIELGSGSSRKTRLLLDALGRQGSPVTYLPVDINQHLLTQSAKDLLQRYPWLSVRALVADFERPLAPVPRGDDVLVAFLGGTIGNLEHEEAVRMLGSLGRAVGPGAALLIGTDMVKPPARLWSAYNDAAGVTARFNLNVLEVINRRLGGSFSLDRFEHLAFFDPVREQVEMHLRARVAHAVRIDRLAMHVRFREGETVRTEISRKFTVQSALRLFAEAGLRVVQRLSPPSGDFSLWLTRVSASPAEDAAGANPLA